MSAINVYVVDAFTNELFGGNRAGVIPDANNLTSVEMLKIAREINASETAFLFPSINEQSDFQIRYFTPMGEIDFCGHATLAAAWVMGTEYDWISKGEELRLEAKIGLVPVTWVVKERKLESVVMTQIEPKTKPFNGDIDRICEMCGCDRDAIDLRFPIKLAYTGNWDLLVPIKTKETMDALKPDFKQIELHNKEHGIISTHVFTFDTGLDDTLLYTRDFSPAVGIDEDPVTGSANGALAGYLLLEGILPMEDHRFNIVQGNALDRPGKLMVKLNVKSGKIQVQVGGAAVISIKGEITL